MNTPAKLTVSVNEAVAITGLSRTSIYRLLSEGRITSTTVGSKRLIHFGSLQQLVEAA